jgi:uncharacterized protein (TIGR03435 family)
MGPTGLTMQAGVPVANFVGMMQNRIGRPVIDKTNPKGLYDLQLTFSPEGLTCPGFSGPRAELGVRKRTGRGSGCRIRPKTDGELDPPERFAHPLAYNDSPCPPE